jgi:hypothetical protein
MAARFMHSYEESKPREKAVKPLSVARSQAEARWLEAAQANRSGDETVTLKDQYDRVAAAQDPSSSVQAPALARFRISLVLRSSRTWLQQPDMRGAGKRSLSRRPDTEVLRTGRQAWPISSGQRTKAHGSRAFRRLAAVRTNATAGTRRRHSCDQHERWTQPACERAPRCKSTLPHAHPE